MAINIENLKKWIGKTEQQDEVIELAPILGLNAVLENNTEKPDYGDIIPPGAHWLYFLPRASQSEIGIDGHPKKGGFLPPVELPRRMWAGSQIEFHAPIRIGDHVTKVSMIHDIQYKQGKSGELLFVTVKHDYSVINKIALTEYQNLVYRQHPSPDAPPIPRKEALDSRDWDREIQPSAALLFRYSALTFNAHRIHYDFPYATQEEGYPDIIVHGQLIATYLLDLARKSNPEASMAKFDFRAVHPAYCSDVIFASGNKPNEDLVSNLWARDADNKLAMQANLSWVK